MKIAYTIATANYLAQAKVLADSFLKHNPEYQFSIILLDKIEGRFDIAYFGPIKIIEIDQLGIQEFPTMVQRYSIFELCNSLKPFVADYLFVTYPEITNCLYFDNDIFIYETLDDIEDLLLHYSIVLTPHIFTPSPLDGFYLDEKAFLNAGIYNAGFFGLKNCADSRAFLSWWKERMKTDCFVDMAKGMFADQNWLNFVPIYFSNVYISKNAGHNVAFWNLYERLLSRNSNGQYIVNGTSPLKFYHFSGFNFNTPDIISKYQNRYSFESRPDILPLFIDYKEAVLQNDYLIFSLLPCHYVILEEPPLEKQIEYNKFDLKWLIKPFISKKWRGKIRNIIAVIKT